MRHLIRTVALLAATLLTLVVAASPADGKQQANASELTGWRFGGPVVCVTNGDNALPLAQAVAAWNAATHNLTLVFRNRCADDYPANRRMTVSSYISATNHVCGYITNNSRDSIGRWLNNPVLRINTNPSDACWQTTVRRDHTTSMYIGWVLGAQMQTSQGYASRVICRCSWSTIHWATVHDGPVVDGLY